MKSGLAMERSVIKFVWCWTNNISDKIFVAYQIHIIQTGKIYKSGSAQIFPDVYINKFIS